MNIKIGTAITWSQYTYIIFYITGDKCYFMGEIDYHKNPWSMVPISCGLSFEDAFKLSGFSDYLKHQYCPYWELMENLPHYHVVGNIVI